MDASQYLTAELTPLDASSPAQGRYEQMLANSATAAICAGPDKLIVSWNTAAEQLFGHSAIDAIGQPLSIIIPNRHRAAHDAGWTRAVQTGRARLAGQSVEILALHADGSELPLDPIDWPTLVKSLPSTAPLRGASILPKRQKDDAT